MHRKQLLALLLLAILSALALLTCAPETTPAVQEEPGRDSAPTIEKGPGLVLFTPTTTPSPDDTATSSPPAQTATAAKVLDLTPTQPITYVVQAGDTLAKIAAMFGVTVEAVVEASDIEDPDVIEVGQVLTLPQEVAALGQETVAALRTPATRAPTAVPSSTEVPIAAPTATIVVAPTAVPTVRPPTPPPAPRTCCKYCCKGKACGDSCISRSYTCHKPPGCACNGCP